MKERRITDERSLPSQAQIQFNEWQSAARASDDVRNRIAVTGGTISRGVFGKCYLLASNGRTVISVDEASKSMQGEAANDAEFERPVTSRRRSC